MNKIYGPEWIDPYEDMSDDELARYGCARTVGFLVVLFLLGIILLLTSCTTIRYVPVVTTHTDTLYISKLQRDSVWLHDSTHVSEQQKGDTMYIKLTKWRTKYVERQVHDTIFQSKTDTVPAPYPVPEYIEKKLSWWQKTRIHAGEVMLCAMVVFIVIGIIKLKKNLYKFI